MADISQSPAIINDLHAPIANPNGQADGAAKLVTNRYDELYTYRSRILGAPFSVKVDSVPGTICHSLVLDPTTMFDTVTSNKLANHRDYVLQELRISATPTNSNASRSAEIAISYWPDGRVKLPTNGLECLRTLGHYENTRTLLAGQPLDWDISPAELAPLYHSCARPVVSEATTPFDLKTCGVIHVALVSKPETFEAQTWSMTISAVVTGVGFRFANMTLLEDVYAPITFPTGIKPTIYYDDVSGVFKAVLLAFDSELPEFTTENYDWESTPIGKMTLTPYEWDTDNDGEKPTKVVISRPHAGRVSSTGGVVHFEFELKLRHRTWDTISVKSFDWQDKPIRLFAYFSQIAPGIEPRRRNYRPATDNMHGSITEAIGYDVITRMHSFKLHKKAPIPEKVSSREHLMHRLTAAMANML